MKWTGYALALGLVFAASDPIGGCLTAAEPIALHPENPHYFLWREQPTILLTSGEHYGAVLNLDFDGAKYLQTLAGDRLNYTRIFSGAYVEPDGAFNIARNTLAPLPGRFIAPWARSSQPGYAGGGNRFDLEQWDPAYFARLKGFLSEASRNGVVVELTLFCPMYEEMQWRLSPMNASNNLQNLGRVARTNVYTLDAHGGLLEVQERLVRKLVTELNDYDNLFFEICNEPYFGGVTIPWQHHIADLITATERSLPHRHLIAQNIANHSARVVDPHPSVSILNFHYATPPETVGLNFGLGRVIGDDETGFRGTNNAAYRTEAWDFLLAGGGLFNNLDYSFTAGIENGTFSYPASQPGGGNPTFRKEMAVLGSFIRSLNVIRMAPDSGVIRGGVPPGGSARALVEPGRAIAIYLRNETSQGPWSARWTGFLEPPATGEYQFHTTSNDGVRLWVDGKCIVDQWTEHPAQEDTGSASLVAGRRVPIRLEYFYNGGQGVTRLAWTPPSGKKDIIPANAFRLPTTGWGLHGEYFHGTDLTRSWGQRDDGELRFEWGVTAPLGGATDAGPVALQVWIPDGSWKAEWISTRDGSVVRREILDGGGVRTLAAPAFNTDIALRILLL
ncbi:MAG: hypothetical protein JNL10_02070 [Verrucomicrobiales bacterium]|nr:hypothetical protein [Verrucomicrobiales bacterium]